MTLNKRTLQKITYSHSPAWKGLIAVCFFSLIHTIQAETFESPENIIGTAEAFITEHLKKELPEGQTFKVSINPLDNRLRLPACDIPLEAALTSLQKQQVNSSVQIQCNGVKPWKIYVSTRIEIFGDILIANSNMPRGHIIEEDDFRLVSRNLNQMTLGYTTSIDDLVGKELTHPIAINQPANSNNTKMPLAIKKGQKVVIIAENNGLEVRSTGKAMSNAMIGDQIKVQATDSKRIVEGIVLDTETIKISL